jgi:type II secretory pathway component GspD/PulD (secretin)
MRTKITSLICALLAVLLAAGAAPAQEKAAEWATITVEADLGMAQFLDGMSKAVGIPVLYDPNGQRIRSQTMGTAFSRMVPKDRLLDAYRSILVFYELIVVPVGPQGYQVHLVLDSRSTNNFVRNKAESVPYEDLEKYADRDGLYISCSIPVRHVDNLTTLRTGLSSMISPAGIGRVHEVPGANAIVVMDFAPTVAQIARVVSQFDVEDPESKWTTAVLELRHAFAPDVVEVLRDLVAPKREQPATPRRQGYVAGPPAEPARIVAYERRNAVVVHGAARDCDLVRNLVASLDQPTVADRVVEVLRLQHASAQEVARLLSMMLKDAVDSSVEPRVLPDRSTNSVVVSADQATVAAVRVVVGVLDTKKGE